MDEKGPLMSRKRELYPLIFIVFAMLFLAAANIITYWNDIKIRTSLERISFVTNNAFDVSNSTYEGVRQLDEASKLYLKKLFDDYVNDSYNLQIALLVLGIIFFISGLIMYINAIMKRKHRGIIEEQIGKESLQAVSGYIKIMKSGGKSDRKIREELVKMGMTNKSADYIIGVLK